MSGTTATALRSRYERALGLSAERQTGECIDYLQNPEILVAEFADSFLMAEAFDHREEAFESEELPVRRRALVDAAVQRMIDAPALKAVGIEPYGFTYVARDIAPLWKQAAAEGESGGLDYVAITREEEPRPILGVVNPSEHGAPFLALLRLFACLAEVGTDAQLERANRFLFKGAIAERVPFDLHVLMVDAAAPDTPSPLMQLTRDLAQIFSQRLSEEWALPPLIRHVQCLRIPRPEFPFDGMLREDWRV